MFKDQIFEDKVAFVTGGGSGIGFETARLFLSYGATVHIASRKKERLQTAHKILSKLGPCYYRVCDIRNRDMVDSMLQSIEDKSGKLDFLINNAGGQFPSIAEDISEKGWNAVINTNLNGTWNMTQQAAKKFFIPQKSGRIINIIVMIYKGFAGMAHTGAARAGVDNLTKSLAVEWSRYNIRVNAIAPGIIRSSGLANYPEELVKAMSAKIPLKRMGEVEEVGNLILYLCSPMADFITGDTIYIDGGQRLWGDMFQL